jgi:hypothetical protein
LRSVQRKRMLDCVLQSGIQGKRAKVGIVGAERTLSAPRGERRGYDRTPTRERENRCQK